jgi:tetratricopeptide (TPR) repeat protein
MSKMKITWDYQYLKKQGIECYNQKKYKEAIHYFKLSITALGQKEATREFPDLHKYFYRSILLRDAPEIDVLIRKKHYEEALERLEKLEKFFNTPWVAKRLKKCRKHALYPFQHQSGYMGYMNYYGEEMIPIKVVDVEEFEGGRAAANLGGYYELIDRSGKIFTNEKFDMVHGTVDGFTTVEKNGKFNLVNPKGKLHIKRWYDFVSPFQKEQLRCVLDGKKWGYLNHKGEVAIPIIYDSVTAFSEELAVVEKDGKFGFINPLGQVIISFQYEQAGGFDQGLAPVMRDRVWGFIDVTTKIGIAPIYKETSSFSNGICGVMNEEGKWGAINKKGEVIIPLLYDNFFSYVNGIAAVEIKGEYYFINKRGVLLGDANYYFKEIFNPS